MGLVLLIILVLLLFGTLPTWRHSRNWGYRGPGIFGVLLVILLVLVVSRAVPW